TIKMITACTAAFRRDEATEKVVSQVNFTMPIYNFCFVLVDKQVASLRKQLLKACQHCGHSNELQAVGQEGRRGIAGETSNERNVGPRPRWRRFFLVGWSF